MRALKLFNTSSKRSLSRDEYASMQGRALKATTGRSVMSGPRRSRRRSRMALPASERAPDINMTKEDMYRFSKLHKLLKRVNLLMEDSLRIMMNKSLRDWGRYVEKVAEGNIHIGDCRKTAIRYVADDAPEVEQRRQLLLRPAAPFLLVVQQSEEKVCANQAEIDDRDAEIANGRRNRMQSLLRSSRKERKLSVKTCPGVHKILLSQRCATNLRSMQTRKNAQRRFARFLTTQSSHSLTLSR